MQSDNPQSEPILWDPIVRLGHWSLVLFFFAAYWSGGDWLGLHAQFGYCVGLIVILRLCWGVLGPAPARFSSFVRPWQELRRYLGELRVQRPGTIKNYASGHDPAGGWMIVLLLATLLVTAISGVLLFALEARGPLGGTFLHNLVQSVPGHGVEIVHERAGDLALILVVAHVAGVLVMSWLTRQNLIQAMFSGRRRNQ